MPRKNKSLDRAATCLAKGLLAVVVGCSLSVQAQSLNGAPVPSPLEPEPTYNADLTIAQFEAAPFSDATKSYLHGLETGFTYVILINKMNNLPTVYCTPEDIQFSSRNLVGLVAEELRLFPDIAADKSFPVAAVLMRALQRNYPCEHRAQ